MWNIVVLTVMAGLAGYYSTMAGRNEIATRTVVQSSNLVESMALYRNAVIDYFTAHPAQYSSVDINTLISTNSLPSWSTLYARPETSIWANYRDPNGTIYIYATSVPPVNIVSDIARLSNNSVLAGEYMAGQTTLYSPVFGNTNVTLPVQAATLFPDGSPVWIGMRR